MEVLTILEWLLAWGLLLFAQSVFINGVYQSATGETKKRVDGSDEDSEMILYPLKKFFEKMETVQVLYTDGALSSLIKRISEKYPALQFINSRVGNYRIGYDSGLDAITLRDWQTIIENDFGITMKVMSLGAEFYKSYDEFKYSKWIRKPAIQCIKCMSSFWGALTFWPVALFIFGFHWIEIPIFFADVFSLTYLNWILYKKAQ